MSSQLVWVRNSNMKSYGNGAPHDTQPLDTGEVFTLRHAINDEKLLVGGYVVPVQPEQMDGLATCTPCGREFISRGYQQQHFINAGHTAIELEDGIQISQGDGEYHYNPLQSGPDRPLEPVGAPAPTRGEATGMMPTTVPVSVVDRRGGGAKADTVFRLG